MYCPFCGKELPEGARFCPECGRNPRDAEGRPEAEEQDSKALSEARRDAVNTLGQIAASAQIQSGERSKSGQQGSGKLPANGKEALIQSLKVVLGVIEELLQKDDAVQRAQERLDRLDEDVAEKKSSMLSLVGLFFLDALILIILAFVDPAEDIWGLAIVAIAVLDIAVFAHGKIQRNRDAKEYKLQQEPLRQQALQEARSELDAFVRAPIVDQIQSVVPADYLTIDAVTFFITALRNCRADTLKEAINLYETEKHQRAMMDMQQDEIDLLVQSVELSRQSVELGKQQLDAQKEMLRAQSRMEEGQRKQIYQTAKLRKQVRFSNAVGIINTAKRWKK